MRESERIGLDRHSYEVQIKELSEKASQEDALRSEVDKLKEFIRRQSVEYSPFRSSWRRSSGGRSTASCR